MTNLEGVLVGVGAFVVAVGVALVWADLVYVGYAREWVRQGKTLPPNVPPIARRVLARDARKDER